MERGAWCAKSNSCAVDFCTGDDCGEAYVGSKEVGSGLMGYDLIECWTTASDDGASASAYAINKIESITCSHFDTRFTQ